MTKTPPTMPEILVSATRYASAPMHKARQARSMSKGVMGCSTPKQALSPVLNKSPAHV